MFIINPFLMFTATEEEGGETEAVEDSQESTEGSPEGAADDEAELEEIDPAEAWNPERARAKIRKLNSEARSVKERLKAAEEAAKTSETEKSAQLTELETKNLHLRVGLRLGLPEELIDRLRGSTEEEVVKDAEGLIDLIAPAPAMSDGRPKPRLRGGTEPAAEPEETDPRKLAALVPRM